MPRTHPPYPPEFRAEAVRSWLRRDDADGSWGQPGDLTAEERDELRRLRREVKMPQQEREILREAAVSFAKETL
jgi:transposase